MQLEVGKIYEGKVTGITKFGAFVELDKDTTGMVHISEVANTFVNDISEHLKEGQEVKVKVLALNDGKIALSIKKALPAPEKSDKKHKQGFGKEGRNGNFQKNDRGDRRGGRRSSGFDKDREPVDFSKNPPPVYDPGQSSGNQDFEDMLNKFKASSEDRFADLKKTMDVKRRNSTRRKG